MRTCRASTLMACRRSAASPMPATRTPLSKAKARAATKERGARWVSSVLSNVKRSIGGSYHAIRLAKYARRYLGEAAYRFNRRFRLREMLPRLLHAMIVCRAV